MLITSHYTTHIMTMALLSPSILSVSPLDQEAKDQKALVTKKRQRKTAVSGIHCRTNPARVEGGRMLVLHTLQSSFSLRNDDDANLLGTGNEDEQVIGCLKRCVELHCSKVQANPRLFHVRCSYDNTKKSMALKPPSSSSSSSSSEQVIHYSIACKTCAEKIVTIPSNNNNWTPKQEAQILKDMEHHETKHYVMSAKVLLFLLEAFIAAILNHYGQ